MARSPKLFVCLKGPVSLRGKLINEHDVDEDGRKLTFDLGHRKDAEIKYLEARGLVMGYTAWLKTPAGKAEQAALKEMQGE